MSVRKSNKNFHAIYDDNTLKNMKRYYGIDTDDEIVKYIKRNRLVEIDEGDHTFQKANRKSQ
jgi:hypothetical protein